MSNTARIQARIDAKLKENVDKIFEEMGMTASQAIKMFYRQVEALKGLPFQPRRYNAETEKAIKEARKRKNMSTYNNLDELFSELDISVK